MKTVKVRIPVAVDPQGRWYSYGGYGWFDGKNQGPNNFDELLELTNHDQIGDGEAHFWITAELPIPEVREIPGKVEWP